MKKIFTIFFIFCLVSALNAQTLPNASFENWQEFSFPNYMQPEFWSTPNPFTSQATVTVVTRSEEAYSGTYSARLETKDLVGGMFQAPGLLTLATFNVNLSTFEYAFGNGLPLQEKVLSFTGMYKYEGAQDDSASVAIYCYKKDGDVYDTIGMGHAFLHDVANWTLFEVNMNYLNDHQPDTFNVIIMSSGIGSLNPGSVMFVDSLSVNTNVGVIDLDMPKLVVNCYPNPANDQVTFEVALPSADRVVFFYDLLGKELGKIAFPSTNLQVSLGEYPSGTILYRVVDPKKGMATGSVVKN
ncbi:MAG: PCMD domain-containing protein [Bacteroidetes bacterium]|nr:PCMD domain-containing protein [Bacteroidota bacterium]